MARRSRQGSPEALRKELVMLLEDFEGKLLKNDLRSQVCNLIPATHLLRDLGSSLLIGDSTASARDRIIAYLRRYPQSLISGEELMVVAGISEYARRIRELRVEFGWPIVNGNSLLQMDADLATLGIETKEECVKDSYLLLEDLQDTEAAYRWRVANEIRKSEKSVKDKLIDYLLHHVGKQVTGEELLYLANGAVEWNRRVRELRTEEGWQISTKSSGRPELPVGVYVLESTKQAEIHDRKIPDLIRIGVLERDRFSCCQCNWNHETRNKADTVRNLLELHHIEHHAKGGLNVLDNLITLCNVCHDDVHRGNISAEALKSMI